MQGLRRLYGGMDLREYFIGGYFFASAISALISSNDISEIPYSSAIRLALPDAKQRNAGLLR